MDGCEDGIDPMAGRRGYVPHGIPGPEMANGTFHGLRVKFPPMRDDCEGDGCAPDESPGRAISAGKREFDAEREVMRRATEERMG
jgi:hypothetical protein